MEHTVSDIHEASRAANSAITELLRITIISFKAGNFEEKNDFIKSVKKYFLKDGVIIENNGVFALTKDFNDFVNSGEGGIYEVDDVEDVLDFLFDSRKDSPLLESSFKFDEKFDVNTMKSIFARNDLYRLMVPFYHGILVCLQKLALKEAGRKKSKEYKLIKREYELLGVTDKLYSLVKYYTSDKNYSRYFYDDNFVDVNHETADEVAKPIYQDLAEHFIFIGIFGFDD